MESIEKVAMVTGGGRGIGRAYASALASEGFAVGVADIDRNAAATAVEGISARGGRAAVLVCDVSHPDSMDRATRSLVHRFGDVDVLVANAGLHLPRWNVPPTGLTAEDWQTLLAVNVVGVVNSARSVRESIARRRGVIVVQGSVAGQRPTTAYGVSKMAVRGVTHALAHELAKDGIRVVGIMPGPIPTEAVLGQVPAERLDELTRAQLVQRRASTDDVVGLLRFLISDDAGFITGESISISGGLWTQV